MAKGENTRSGLLWEVERLLNECTELPQILLMENVTQVHGKKNIEHFNEWIAFLESKGYRNYWKDLNAKNFCIPQNRNRTFMVSTLGDYTYEFPQEFPLNKRLKDLLEREVDEKFYISNEKVEKIINSNFGQEKAMIQKTDVCGTLLARDYKDPKCVEVEPVRLGGLYDDEKGKHQAGAIWDKETIAPTVDTMQGGNRQPLITEEPKVKRLGNVYNEKFTGYSFGGNVWDKNGLAPTLKTTAAASQQFVVDGEPLAYDEQNGYIRKDSTVGTLTTDGSSPKHNNRVIEFAKEVVNSGVLETESAEIYSYDGYNNKINKSDCIGTVVPQNSRWGLTNGYKIVEVEPNNKTIENCYVSEKGVRFICSPKRGMATDVNADICQPLTAKGQANWTGSFVSPDIESLEKSSTIGSTEPTKINLKNGETITSNDNLSSLRIRKLTPKECWRLMGFTDEDFEKAEQYNSNSQLYKQAGNSIVVSVLYYIFKGMF
jgi:site-specific DNA-cytosine methylase